MEISKAPICDLPSLLNVIKELETKYNSVDQPDERIVQLISDSKEAVVKIQDKKNYDYGDVKSSIQSAGKTLTSTIAMIEAAGKGDWFAVGEIGLEVIAGLAMTIGTIAGIFTGPVCPFIGAAFAAVCVAVSAIVALFKPKEESLVSQIRKVIVEELKRYEYNEVTKRKVQGWCQVEASIIQELSFHHQKLVKTGTCSYKGFDPQRFDNERELMGEIIFLAQEQFAALVEEKHEKKGNAEKCLDCIGGYASIARYYIMILSLHKILCSHINTKSIQSQETTAQKQINLPSFNPSEGHFSDDIEFLDMKIKAAKSDAKMFLDFLSDERLLGASGWWLGKLRVMKQYRENPSIFSSVESFRESIGCTPTTYHIDTSTSMLKQCNSAERSKLTPKFKWPQRQHIPDDKDYLMIVNNTQWDVCIFSGIVGSYKNESVEFTVSPQSTSVMPAHPSSKTVSSGGIITMGRKVEKLVAMRDVQILEFCISNKYSFKITTLPVQTYITFHLEKTYDAMKTPDDDAKVFYFHGGMYFVQGKMEDRGSFGVFKIVIEEFGLEKLIARTTGMPS